MKKIGAILAVSCLAVLAARPGVGAEPLAANVSAERLSKATAENGNWMLHGRTYKEERFSPLDQIKRENLEQLNLAWHADLDSERGQEATPIVVDGIMYVSTAWSKVFALDAASGKQLWSYDPKVPGEWAVHACCDVVNRGVAVWEGKVFVGTLDGRLVALDSRTGMPVWETLTIDRKYPYTITGAPRVVKGKVIIGNGGAEMGVRGYVTAYDSETGKQVWRFYTVPGDPSKPFESPILASAAKTWSGEWWKFGGGGTVWDSMSYDPELDLLYIGVGNGSPWNHKIRSEGKGDNLFLSSIVALRPDTGEYVWHYQTTPGDSWDYTATQHMILADMQIEGQERKVLMQAPKNGFFYVLDRTNGKLISAEKYAAMNWATGVDKETGRPIENPEARYANNPNGLFIALPGPSGAHNWHPMSFSPRTGLVYIPALTLGFPFLADTSMTADREQGWNAGVRMGVGLLPTDKRTRDEMKANVFGQLLAWDPIRQKAAWAVRHPGVWNGGVLSTAADLVFQGTQQGELVAYSAADGTKLWSRKTLSGVIAPPISYAVNGEQYVAVLVGFGGSIALTGGEAALGTFPQPNKPRLLAFKIGGKDVLAVGAERTAVTTTSVPPKIGDVQTVANGNELYHLYCGACHGIGAISGGVLPDLRHSELVGSRDAFNSVVREGALKSRGMAPFAAVLSDSQTEAIRAYVIDRAHNPIPEEVQ
ncbi:PQQ-dependent dehydrogenase, methanol/ethanol family [Bradyrhizobium sp. CCBAU 51627]|uniref:PQQ-dependent dehydrogenase, methanol/ethanol family n=1 Tax=Bradyrhizobium sp. CCBAU 51627 TaxID=1325088 RepID=UPI002305AF8A|nr:PQQ-dependent dehydrogenase, methanol/ethanol family [Bradyrhizobium sp. CCBAU 51627]MDA9433780.1 alcohol dehydrogenase [Bradyrhizobium sp. CCBAU 51627]